MSERSGREVVELYARAIYEADQKTLDQILADDITEEYPQSGERVRGKANLRAVVENYPGLEGRGLAGRSKIDRVVGEEDRWVTGPDWRVLRVVGTGDHFTVAGRITYPDGSVWHAVSLVELRNGKIAKLTTYFAAPFEAPAWRAQWVERVETPGTGGSPTAPPDRSSR